MEMSTDGRSVACLASGGGRSRIIIWSCYACNALLPSFYALQQRECLHSKELVELHVPSMLKQFGSNLLNYARPHGKTFLFDAIDAVNDEVLDVSLRHAHRKQIKVRCGSATNVIHAVS